MYLKSHIIIPEKKGYSIVYFKVERKTAFSTSLSKYMLVSVLSVNIIGIYFYLMIF